MDKDLITVNNLPSKEVQEDLENTFLGELKEALSKLEFVNSQYELPMYEGFSFPSDLREKIIDRVDKDLARFLISYVQKIPVNEKSDKPGQKLDLMKGLCVCKIEDLFQLFYFIIRNPDNSNRFKDMGLVKEIINVKVRKL